MCVVLCRIECLERHGLQPFLPHGCVVVGLCVVAELFMQNVFLHVLLCCQYVTQLLILSGGFWVLKIKFRWVWHFLKWSGFYLLVVGAERSVYSTWSLFLYQPLHACPGMIFLDSYSSTGDIPTRQVSCLSEKGRKQYGLDQIGLLCHFLKTWPLAAGCLAYKTVLHIS